MPNVLYITNLPTPYRLPLYRELGQRLALEGVLLEIFFLGYSRSDRAWNIGEEDFAGLKYSIAKHPSQILIRDAAAAIARSRPAVVVLAWAMDLAALRLMLHCRLRGIPCIVVSGETLRSAANNPYAFLRNIFRRPVFRFASAFITYGTGSTEYLLASGVEPERVVTGINVVDTDYFSRCVDELRINGAAAEERARYGESFSCHLLFVGYLLPEKGMMNVLAAFGGIERSDIALHVVGSGPEMDALRSRVERDGLAGRVFFHGYRQIDQLPLYYALADILIFPSLEEVFGLVMVEGAAAGLPMIASANAGGTADVVNDGVNGIIIDPADIDSIAAAIARLADDPALRRAMGAASRRVAGGTLNLRESARRYMDVIMRYIRR
ncbi:MAG: glycosyl transferase group 1 [Chlorobi bacterium]|nr:glycosyl transferase group 1 [Chlorobiota bacterium]